MVLKHLDWKKPWMENIKILVVISDTKHRHFKGTTNNLIIRLQIGFEDINDSINDLDNSFHHVVNNKAIKFDQT